MKNDERCAYGQTARSAFFRGVEPEAAQNSLADREARGSDQTRFRETLAAARARDGRGGSVARAADARCT
jgi:hypothetical protein